MRPQNSQKFDFNNLFIFEMANNHQGDLSHGKRIVREMARIAREHGIRAAVKLQFRDLDTFIHPAHRENREHKHIGRFLSTRLTEEEFAELLNEIRSEGLITMVTPFDELSVGLIEKLNVDVIKIGSPSARDWPLLERVSQSDKPIIVSTGGLALRDIDNIASFFEHRYKHIALMHCVSIYPTPHEKLELNQIELLRHRYPGISIGFSTHEEPDNSEAIQVAFSKGARLFERHVGIPTDTITLNKYSSTPEQISRWIAAYKRAVAICGGMTRPDTDPKESADLSSLFRGVYAKRDIHTGDKVNWADVFFAMPINDGQLSSGQFRDGLVADREYKQHEGLSSSLASSKPLKKHLIYQAIHDVKGMLNEARVPIGEGGFFDVELSHHYGLERFHEVGVVIIDCINREYGKKILVQLAGQTHPHHYHKKKEEAFHVIYGELHVEMNGKEQIGRASCRERV